ncbi:MAG: type III pantothenate kinase [Candidatus Omnitrophota bacterium]|nr:type III pantothenate kinase [Candidatus Omnitrophota bacterium]
MLLAVDIGNTNIAFGLFVKKRLIHRFNIPTHGEYIFSQLKKEIGKRIIDEAIICSVVPVATEKIKKILKIILGKQSKIVGKDIKIPVENLYLKPRQVGHDRLVNAYAGIKLYGAPLIVVDFGTAITFDVVSAKGEYLGGMILPGLQISLDCLAEKTALLPRIKLKSPKEFIGRDTPNSMLSGIVYGFAALSDSLILKIKSKIGRSVRCIGTGGGIKLIGKCCHKIDRIDTDLTIKGLNLIYLRQQERKH